MDQTTINYRMQVFITALLQPDFESLEWHDTKNSQCVVQKIPSDPSKYLYREWPEFYDPEDGIVSEEFGPEKFAEYAAKYALSIPEDGTATYYGYTN